MFRKVALAVTGLAAALTLVVPATASAEPATTDATPAASVVQTTPVQSFGLAICLNVPLGSVSVSFCL